MPRPRFTLRWLMVAVAIAGLLAWGVRLRRIAQSHQMRAAVHRRQEALCSKIVEPVTFDGSQYHLRIGSVEVTSVSINIRPNGADPAWIDAEDHLKHGRAYNDWRREGERQASLAAKYEYAARHPWLPVAPDPPDPE